MLFLRSRDAAHKELALALKDRVSCKRSLDTSLHHARPPKQERDMPGKSKETEKKCHSSPLPRNPNRKRPKAFPIGFLLAAYGFCPAETKQAPLSQNCHIFRFILLTQIVDRARPFARPVFKGAPGPTNPLGLIPSTLIRHAVALMSDRGRLVAPPTAIGRPRSQWPPLAAQMWSARRKTRTPVRYRRSQQY